jgi:plastocyanin
MVTIAVIALATAGCGGAATPPPTYPPGSVVVTAKDHHFDTGVIHLPANTQSSLVFVNRDSDMHNIAIRTKQGFDGDVLFRFDPIAASTVVLTVGPIPAGTYYFLCEVHPAMTGTVTVQ